MDTPESQTAPPDEYERLRDERLLAAGRSLRRCLTLWACGQSAVVLLAGLFVYVLMSVAFGHGPPTPGTNDRVLWSIVGLAGLAGLCSLAAAGRAAVLGLRHWRGLSGFRRGAALLPWLVTSAEALWLLMQW